MGISELTDREAVLRAIEECNRLGRDGFRRQYGFGPARDYLLFHGGREYDSKAIAGVAFGYQFPERGPLSSGDFVGGAATVAPVLERLGFVVRRPGAPRVEVGQFYSWEELGKLFGFRPDYLLAAGGMVPRPEFDALLVITHPEGGRSFDYRDYWDDRDLIYTGRGQIGHQALEGANRDVADNRRVLYVFEHVGPKTLRFRGTARCVDWWPDSGPDRNGDLRRIYRFRLRFADADEDAAPTARGRGEWAAPLRRPRRFDRSRRPRPPRRGVHQVTAEEILAQQEKASAGHHELLAAIDRALEAVAWLDIEEVPAAIDLRARPAEPDSNRVLFEAKTVGLTNEMQRVRAGLAQLLEYRFFYGGETDELCLVVSRPISDERVRFLRAMGVDVIWPEAGTFVTRGQSVNPSVRLFLAQRAEEPDSVPRRYAGSFRRGTGSSGCLERTTGRRA